MKSKPVIKAPPAKKQPRRISAQYLENAALYYLQRYATSAENFRRVMTRKINRSCTFHEVAPEPFYAVLEDMILRYISSGLLNDQGFAEAKTATLRRQGRSRQSILGKLQAKGLSKPHIEAALESADAEKDGDPELAAAIVLARRKKLGPWRTKPLKDPARDRQKEMAALARAGFSYEIARKALDYSEEDSGY